MVLKLRQEGRYTRDEIEKACFPYIFLTMLAGKQPPKITRATIEGNKLELITDKTIGGVDGQSFKPTWVDYTIQGGRDSEPKATFQLNPEYNYTFEFKAGNKFHEVMREIFNTQGFPDEIGISATYKTPPAFWRGLPRVFKENIIKFNFCGKHFVISWPREENIQYGEPVKHEDELGYSTPDSTFEEREGFLALKERLLTIPGVNYQRKEERGITINHFKVKNMNPDLMERLEEITREKLELRKHGSFFGSESTVTILGNVPRASLEDFPTEFDDYLGLGRSSAKCGDVTVTYERKGGNTPPVRVIYQNATLESAERIISSHVSTNQLWITPRNQRGMIAENGTTLFSKE